MQIYLIIYLLLRIHDMQKNIKWFMHLLGYIFGPDSKESTYQCKRRGFDPWVRKTSWRMEWKLTLVFLPGESHGWRSLEGSYSPWDWKESDMTEIISIQIFFSNIFKFIGKITLYTVQIIIFGRCCKIVPQICLMLSLSHGIHDNAYYFPHCF